MTNFLKAIAAFMLISLTAAQTSLAQEETELGPTGLPVPIPSVKLIGSQDQENAFVRRFFGRIAARETVDLSFEVGGRLVTLPVVEGETIPQGTVVAALETETFERAVVRAELALAQARREETRSAQLAASNVASAVRAEDAVTARELAEVALDDAHAAITMLT